MQLQMRFDYENQIKLSSFSVESKCNYFIRLQLLFLEIKMYRNIMMKIHCLYKTFKFVIFSGKQKYFRISEGFTFNLI